MPPGSFIDLALGAHLLGLGQLLADLLGQLVHLLGLAGHLGRQLLLGLGQPLLGQLRAPVAVVDEALEVLAGLEEEEQEK